MFRRIVWLFLSAGLPLMLLRWTVGSPRFLGISPIAKTDSIASDATRLNEYGGTRLEIGAVETRSVDSIPFSSQIEAQNPGAPELVSPVAHQTKIAVVITAAGQVLIDAVLYDGYEADHLDEAVRIQNVGSTDINIGGWYLNDGELSKSYFPTNTILSPGQMVWTTKSGEGFLRQFGHLPGFELKNSPTLTVPDLLGGWPLLNDSGDQVALYDLDGNIIDCLVYEQASSDICATAWIGESVWPYKAGTTFAEEGQILYRRRDAATGISVPDTNTAADWAQAVDDVIDGRKLFYPGWDLEPFFFTRRLTESAIITVAVAPDNAYQAIVDAIGGAKTSIQIESLTLENLAIGDALTAAADRGVTVTLLLEGGPIGGISDAEKHICQLLESAGAQCWFMINDSAQAIHDRYRYLHAKVILIDGRQLVVSSENLSPNSMPYDDKADGTWGRRGVLLIVDAPSLVDHVQTIFNYDLDKTKHQDIFRWQSGHPAYGSPSAGFVPFTVTGGISYSVRYTRPTAFSGTFQFEIIQSPENSLRENDGVLGLVNQAGSGDVILIEQLSERPHWGPVNSDPVADPNPRLDAFIAAARRGAYVRLLLDSFYDDATSAVSNQATCDFVKHVAEAEKLAMDCALANPTGLGIHGKIVLARIGGQGVIHVGSINGTESSHKANRELAIQVVSDGAYALLADMFERDWPHKVYFPTIYLSYLGPASHPLISEILYDPPGLDDDEFIEVVNPTGSTVDLSGYGLGDAVARSDFEDVRRFPPGSLVGPGETLIIATTASAFRNAYGFNPDFEIVNTDLLVMDMIDDMSWGDPGTWLQLGNTGDEVILRDTADQVVDVVVYGNGNYPGNVACELVTLVNASLERKPYWRDTDDCTADFREWPFPNPGSLPDNRLTQ